ncbi:MAG: Uma2 family endonuclease [Acidimicrobiales bacterium]
MRAVLVNVSDSVVEERGRLGIDKQDERWKGEWHFVNPPKRWHPRLNTDMTMVLGPLARRVGLEPYSDGTGLFAGPRDWRVPDQVYVRPDQETDEGVTGAELVVELRSPGDESHAKLPFYAARGVTEVLIVDEDRRVELYRLDDSGTYQPVADGGSAVLGVTFTTVAPLPAPGAARAQWPRLRIDWDGGSAEV